MFGAGHPDAWRHDRYTRCGTGTIDGSRSGTRSSRRRIRAPHRASRRQRVGDRRGHRRRRYGARALATSGRACSTRFPWSSNSTTIPRTSGSTDSIERRASRAGSDVRLVLSHRHESRGDRTSRWRHSACDCLETRRHGSPPAMPISSSRARRSRADWSNRSCSLRVRATSPSGSRSASGSRFGFPRSDRALRSASTAPPETSTSFDMAVADSLVRRMSWEQSAADEVTLTLELSRPVWGYRARWDGQRSAAGRPPATRDRSWQSALGPAHRGGPRPSAGRSDRSHGSSRSGGESRRGARAPPVARGGGGTRPHDAHDRHRRRSLAHGWPWPNEPMPMCSSPFTTTRCPTESTHLRTTAASVYYNHPRSIPARARCAYRRLLARLGLRDLGIGRGDFALVRGTWMPSVLTEGLFMMLPDQEAALAVPAGAAAVRACGLRRTPEISR